MGETRTMAAGAARRRCRVWIFNHYATPPDRPGGTRHYWFGRAVGRHGGDVTIFAAGFDHATGQEARVHGRALSRTSTHDGVRFVWLRTLPYRGNDWRRSLNMIGYAVLVTLTQFGRPAPDVVVGSSVHPFAALAGWLVARLRRARFVYEVRDLWPQTMIDVGAMDPRSGSARLLYGIEAFLARRASVILTVLPGMQAYLAERGLPTDGVVYLPNGAVVVDAASDSSPGGPGPERAVGVLPAAVTDAIDGVRSTGATIFAWTGAHGRVNGLDIAIEAVARAATAGGPPVHLILVGDGPEKPALRRLATDRGAPVTFLDPVSKEQVAALLALVDVGVIHAAPTPVHRYGISFNKLFDYMAAGLPVVFACDAFADPVAAAGCGVTVAPGDPVALARAMTDMAALPADARHRIGAAGRAYLDREHDLIDLGDRFVRAIGCD